MKSFVAVLQWDGENTAAKKAKFCQILRKTTFGHEASLLALTRSCVEALRLLGEAGKCRKLDSQVRD